MEVGGTEEGGRGGGKLFILSQLRLLSRVLFVRYIRMLINRKGPMAGFEEFKHNHIEDPHS